MDFKEIGKKDINFNPAQISKKQDIKKGNNINSGEKEEIKGKSPASPDYWQSSIGIKPGKISFQGSKKDTVDDAYIGKRLAEIISYYYWVPKEEITERYLGYLKELKEYGKQAFDNYADTMIYTKATFMSDEERSNFNDLTSSFFKLAPDISKDYVGHIATILKIASNPKINMDYVKTILDTTMSKSGIDEEARLVWLNKEMYNFISLDDAQAADRMNHYEEDFNTYINFIETLNVEKEKHKQAFSTLSTSLIKRITDLVNEGTLDKNDVRNFLRREVGVYENPDTKEKLQEIISRVEQDDKLAKLFSLLIENRLYSAPMHTKTILELFDGDIDFLIKLIERYKERVADSDGTDIVADREFLQLISMTDDSNIDDFFSIYSDLPLSHGIWRAFKNRNPITGLFSKQIIDKTNEFEKQGMSSYDSLPLAIACIDGKTGEFSPFALQTLDLFYYPAKKDSSFKGKLNSIKQNIYKYHLTKKRVYLHDSPLRLINSLKDKDGAFDENNYQYMLKIIKLLSRTYSQYSASFEDIAEILDTLKDKNGIIDSNKFNDFINLYKKFGSNHNVFMVVRTLNEFPEEKRQEILDTFCTLLYPNKHNYIYIPKDFPNLAKFCFDEKGNQKPDNISFIQSIIKNRGYIFTDTLFETLEKHPELRDFWSDMIINHNCYPNDQLLTIMDKDKEKNGGHISQGLLDKIREYGEAGNELASFSNIYKACYNIQDENGNSKFNDKMFHDIIQFKKLAKELDIFGFYINGKDYLNIINGSFNPLNINFSQRIDILNDLIKMKKYVDANKIQDFEYVDKVISILESSLRVADNSLPIDNVSKTNFINSVLFSRNEYTQFENTIIESIPLLETMENGLPLSYSREEFLKDLTEICSDKSDIDLLVQKTGINPITKEINGATKITGYNGLIKLDELDKNNPKELQIYECMHRFMYDNEVTTGNAELDKQLNIIIKAWPEFINTIGKKQHGTHKYSLDIHSLLVLAYSMENPSYLTKLNSLDRAMLKISAIFHDIMKKEFVIDKGHQHLSSLYTRSIVHKIFNAPDIQDRIFGLVDNHHWIEEFSTTADSEYSAKEIAFKFRIPNDFEIAKIMADSDLKAVNPDFYKRLSGNLDDKKIQPIRDNIDYLYSQGNAIFSDYIVSPQYLDKCIETKNGKEYKVINLNNIPDGEDMGKYGFHAGTKKEDLTFLVHMVDNENIYNGLSTVKLLTSPFNGGVFSESLITPKYNRTYGKRKYGVILSQSNINVINEKDQNQGSGNKKDLNNVITLIFSRGWSNNRLNFRNQLIQNLGLSYEEISDKEYAQFYRENLATKTAYNQISPGRKYKIGEFEVTGKQLIDAIKSYQESLIDKTEVKHNEIVGYTPKIQAVIAKAPNLNNVPEELLKFAYENNYPIILI